MKTMRLRYGFAMHSDLLGVAQAARELGVAQSRVRSLISSGDLGAEKIGGRWLLDRRDILTRRRQPVGPGRPLSPRNAWILLLEASGEQPPDPVDPGARWRMRRSLEHPGLVAMRPRIVRRARSHRFWALAAELRALREEDSIVRTGSSAAGELGLKLLSPDALDAYLPTSKLAPLVRHHGLQEAAEGDANVLFREVPDDAWMLQQRRVAPAAAVGLDLASYADPRSSRAGLQLLGEIADERPAQ